MRPVKSRMSGSGLVPRWSFALVAVLGLWVSGAEVPSGFGMGGHDSLAAGELEVPGDPIPPVPPVAPVKPLSAEDPLPPGADVARVDFRLQVRDVVIPYPVMAITALPGEWLDLELDMTTVGTGERAGFRLLDGDGAVDAHEPGRWRWQVPTVPGAVALRLESPLRDQAIHLNVLVLHPFEDVENGVLDGYRIGQYRTGPGREAPPAGFVRGTPDLLDLRVAPDFTLRQFLCKQPGEPSFLALSEPLLLKLQAILEEVRAEGIQAETLHVMSGFRTPAYNRAIGNVTDGSRHLWGDAADIFIDGTGNGWMDDLNGDGRVDAADAEILYRIAERVERRGEPHVQPGGLSLYRENAVRGPFIHVDTRGVPARW